MTRMNTRSSARRLQNEEINSNHDQTSKKNFRQARRVYVFSSDDSDDNTKIGQCSSNNRKSRMIKRGAAKPDNNLTNNSDQEGQNVKLSTPRKQKLHSSQKDLDQGNCASPSKQKKTTENPHTPHKKIPQHEEVQTPSRLLLKLKLTSPTHANATIINNSVHSNRKQLFEESMEKTNLLQNDDYETEKKDRKPGTVYQNARKALHSTFPTDMPGRENELNELREFMKSHIEKKMSGSLYVSGPPGTGKTASLNMILQEDTILSELRKVYVNCTAIKSPKAIYSRIAKELDVKVSGKTEKDCLVAVENFLKKQNRMILFVLDEIDQLESKNQSILYTIYEWPAKLSSKVILVGIANALDLTDRILPRLQARCELKPKLMHFAPYTKQQIVQIFTSRLKSAGALEVFSPMALQMLAGKVAAISGDVRRALDIGRRVIELVDQSKSGDVLKPIDNLTEELLDKETKKNENRPKVELKQVVNVLNSVYGTSQNLTDDSEDTFPLQQKIIICSLILMLKKAKNKDITVGRLHEVYQRVCAKRNILSVDQAEFVGLCSLIETYGILRVTRKKEPRLNKVNLEWDEEEVAAALKDKQLMSTILQDDSCLGKL